MAGSELRIDRERLLGRIEALGQAGALAGGGVCRLALTDDDTLWCFTVALDSEPFWVSWVS